MLGPVMFPGWLWRKSLRGFVLNHIHRVCDEMESHQHWVYCGLSLHCRKLGLIFFLVDGGWTTINPGRQTATQTVRPPFPRPFLFSERLWRWTYCTDTLYPCCASTRSACVRVESWRNVPRNHLITESWLSPFFFNTLTSSRHTWHDPSQDSLGHTKHFSWEPV